MYFPLLRGRQYELLALRELLSNNRISSSIIPIVEPVRFSSTLISVINLFVQQQRKIALILNPKVGNFYESFYDSSIDQDRKKSYELLLENSLIIKAYWVENDLEISDRNNCMVISKNSDSLTTTIDIVNKYNPKYILIPDDRRFKREVKGQRVILEDYFNKRRKNSEYLEFEDEFYSDINLEYINEKCIGFSDYSIVGDDFTESGFAPMAVAIHIVYLDFNKELRVRHFVSDSNFDISDPAGKFKEALCKLINWKKTFMIENTLGLEEFDDCYKNEKYPGLGSIKKMSLMHHLEIISKFLDGEKE